MSPQFKAMASLALPNIDVLKTAGSQIAKLVLDVRNSPKPVEDDDFVLGGTDSRTASVEPSSSKKNVDEASGGLPAAALGALPPKPSSRLPSPRISRSPSAAIESPRTPRSPSAALQSPRISRSPSAKLLPPPSDGGSETRVGRSPTDTPLPAVSDKPLWPEGDDEHLFDGLEEPRKPSATRSKRKVIKSPESARKKQTSGGCLARRLRPSMTIS
jgi:hypothetical protein